MSDDPIVTDPDLYRVLFENDRVRVLEYRDQPGDQTNSHRHPDSVMVPLSSFRRRLLHDGRQVDAELRAGEVRWVDAQEHAGHNIGDTGSHAIFVELKEPAPSASAGSAGRLGPRTI
jgi:beta-alanine degradation protein BauB